MKNYVAEFESKIKKINQEIQNINIINAGVMNNGKSSLFNSLLDREEFKAQDIRTTTDNRAVNWFDNVYLIDTPGLVAEISDDEEAFAGYKRANMILFVHTIRVGELRKNELDAINQMKKLFIDEKFFWQHFCLVLTFLDEDKDNSGKIIYEKILVDIKNHCNGTNFKTFIVSNSRYKKGLETNKEAMKKLSGILELKDYLRENINKWKSENRTIKMQRIANEKNELISQMTMERQKIEQKISKKKRELTNEQMSFMNKIEQVMSMKRAEESEVESKENRLRQLKRELSKLKDKHERESW